MYYYKEVRYENGSFRFYFIQEPDWKESSLGIEYEIYDVNHESFLLDALDYLLCGLHVSNVGTAKGLLYSLISSLTGVFILKE